MELTLIKKDNALSATLLIAGCCIGAGMIGLPVVSAMAGFIPATLAMLFCYFFATASGLLIMEATLWFDHEVNLLSLSEFALGKAGRLITWMLFLFLFYCLFVAYIDGGGMIFAEALTVLFQTSVAREIGILVCVGFVGTIVFTGIIGVASVNRVFLLALGLSYCALVGLGLSHVDTNQLLYGNMKGVFAAIPIMLVCFGYQNLVPTLTYYVKRNPSVLRLAILIGNMIPFVVYTLWNYVIIGILPDANPATFGALANQKDLVTQLLESTSQSPAVMLSVKIFSFFALVTPFMGNSLSFVDFLKDGLKRTAIANNRPLIIAMVFVPPMLVSLIYPHLFLKALGLVGGFADVLLFGVLPVAVVFVGRYVKKMEGPYTVAGGKLFLAVFLVLSIALLLLRN